MCNVKNSLDALMSEANAVLGDDFFDVLKEMAILNKRINTLEKNHKGWKATLARLMAEYDVKSITLEDGTVVSYKPAYDSLIADTDKMKEDGIYAEYSKVSHHNETTAFKAPK